MLPLRRDVNKGDINITDATKLCCRNKKKIYIFKTYMELEDKIFKGGF